MMIHKGCNLYTLNGIILYFSVLPESSVGSVWSWILNEPFPHSDVALASTLQPTNDTTEIAHALSHDHPLRTGTPDRLNIQVVSPCQSNKVCGRGKFCDVLYGRCDRVKRRGEFCRKDNHCQRKHECVFGRCRKEIPKGQEGSRCSLDNDCSPNHCCARQHGEFICKPRLKHSSKCFVPAGGLDYSLNEQCPCEVGLICQYDPAAKLPTSSPSANKPQKHEWFQFSSDTDQMRCLPVSFSSNGDVYNDEPSESLSREE